MKKALFSTLILTGVTLSIIGCGGGGSSKKDPIGGGGGSSKKDPIVGTWKSACYEQEDNYAKTTISFKSDGNGMIKQVNYEDNECSQSNGDEHTKSFKYSLGKKTKDSEGEPAKEIDVTTQERKYYSMYKFKDNGNLLLADTDENSDNYGYDAEHREDYFDPEDEGLKRVK